MAAGASIPDGDTTPHHEHAVALADGVEASQPAAPARREANHV